MRPYTDLHQFWFGNLSEDKFYFEDKIKQWFFKNETHDELIRNEWAPLLEEHIAQFESWKTTPSGWTSLVLLFDQVPRNSFRESPKMYAYDPLALELALEVIEQDWDKLAHPIERLFLYLPFEHSEDLEIQKLSIRKFEDLFENSEGDLRTFAEQNLQYAIDHFKIIEEYGRFPHRNEILGRKSSDKEIEFLKTPGSSF